ncbi:MAG: hypothetical protein ACOCG5_00805 [Candidatus Alkaliphilus sp. MAG34]
MNTSGFIRGYMAKNMDVEEFIKRVIGALNREFEELDNGILLEIKNDEFLIEMEKHQISISKEEAGELKSPYGLDKYLLDEFQKQGFELDKNRSQYIKYCCGNFANAEVIDIEE